MTLETHGTSGQSVRLYDGNAAVWYATPEMHIVCSSVVTPHAHPVYVWHAIAAPRPSIVTEYFSASGAKCAAPCHAVSDGMSVRVISPAVPTPAVVDALSWIPLSWKMSFASTRASGTNVSLDATIDVLALQSTIAPPRTPRERSASTCTPRSNN